MSTDRSEGTVARSESEPDRSDPPLDPERLRRRLRRRTDEIERHEVDEAISALDARGDLTEEQREIVRDLGSALVEELTAAPEQTLERAARIEPPEERDRMRTRAIRRLFDLGEA
ncbi:glutamyl-tRNA reductase [Halorubrum saccharovorum]|uniref:Glutamyl-tRNA reductase n=1 Tax=Halorubrum saccharovorum TaxID=2248 RepID=A0A081EUH8_9EURY|nr:glutamyl-tRNA reductase [Halorubrum saccharovorum]KDS91066.1 glutamyl-tRNA reductase [Halorubrum saccharovorum]